MMRRMTTFLLAFSLLSAAMPNGAWAAGAVVPQTDLDDMIEAQEKAKEELGKKIQRYDDIAKQKARQSRGVLGQLTELRQEASRSRAKIEGLEKENERLQGAMMELNVAVAQTNNAVADLLVSLRSRVVDMYKFSSREDLDILFAAKDAHDALTTAYMLGRLAHRDRSIIEALSGKAEELGRARAQIEANRDLVQRQTEELRRKRGELDATIKKTDALLKDIQGQQRKAMSAAQELAAAQQAIGDKILALTRQKRTREGGASDLTVPQSAPPSPVGPAPRPQSYAYLEKGTALEWPVAGPIAAPFGSRIHPVFKTKVFNSGIDIKAASGAPVRAAGPGEVLFKGWIRGFGQVVIIDHGSDLSTVYAHLASASVGERDAVRTGSLIGTVGNSGISTEHGLHFEVRSKGAAQDPMRYLRKI